MGSNGVIENLERIALGASLPASFAVKSLHPDLPAPQLINAPAPKRQYPSHPNIRIHDVAPVDDLAIIATQQQHHALPPTGGHARRGTVGSNNGFLDTHHTLSPPPRRVVVVPPVPGMSEEERRMLVVSPSAETVRGVHEWLKRPFTPNSSSNTTTNIIPTAASFMDTRTAANSKLDKATKNSALPPQAVAQPSKALRAPLISMRRGQRPAVAISSAHVNSRPRFAVPAPFFGARQQPLRVAPASTTYFDSETEGVPGKSLDVGSVAVVPPLASIQTFKALSHTPHMARWDSQAVHTMNPTRIGGNRQVTAVVMRPQPVGTNLHRAPATNLQPRPSHSESSPQQMPAPVYQKTLHHHRSSTLPSHPNPLHFAAPQATLAQPRGQIYIPDNPTPPQASHSRAPPPLMPRTSLVPAAAESAGPVWHGPPDTVATYTQPRALHPHLSAAPSVYGAAGKRRTEAARRYMKFRPKTAPGAEDEVDDDEEDEDVARPCDYVNVIDTVLDFGPSAAVIDAPKQKALSGILGRIGNSLIGGIDMFGSKLAGLLGITNGRYEEYYGDAEEYEYELELAQAEAEASHELKSALSSV
ncbi:hypothetical protein BC830DRAFT_1114589 [Chytriomyces sp. MP71]|nr:hypothetical protein BC830DRAFT_1114589 [Chytriomyces sp. MP71]